MSLLLQSLALFGGPLGTLIYHLGMCVLVATAAALAALHARRAAAPLAPAWGALAAALLLAASVQAAAMVMAASSWAAPTERAASSFTLVVALLTMAAPLSRRVTLAAVGLMGAAASAGLAASLLIWPAGALDTPFYNGTLPDLLWLVAQVGLLISGLAALAARHRPGWLAGIGLLVLLLGGQAWHYAFPLGNLDAPVSVRLAELVAWPLLLLVLALRGRAATNPALLPAVVARVHPLPEPAAERTPDGWVSPVSEIAGETTLTARGNGHLPSPALSAAPAPDDLNLAEAVPAFSDLSDPITTTAEAAATSYPLSGNEDESEATMVTGPVSEAAWAPANDPDERSDFAPLSEDTQPVAAVRALPTVPAQAEPKTKEARLEGEPGEMTAKASQTAESPGASPTEAALQSAAAQALGSTRHAEQEAMALQITDLQAALETARAELQDSHQAQLAAAAQALAQSQAHTAATASLQQRLDALEKQEALLQRAFRQSQIQLQTDSAERQAQAVETEKVLAEARAAAQSLSERLVTAETDLNVQIGKRDQHAVELQAAIVLHEQRQVELQIQIEQRDQRLAEQVAEAEGHTAQFQTALQAAEAQASAAQAALAKAEADQRSLEENLARLQGQLLARDQQMAELTAKGQQTAVDRQDLQTEANALRASLTDLRAERSRLAEGLASVQGQLQQRDQRLARLLNQAEAQAHQDLLHRQALHAAQAEAADLRASLTETQAELSAARSEMKAAALQFSPAPTPLPPSGNGHGNGNGIHAAVAAPDETRVQRPAKPETPPAANASELTETLPKNASQPADAAVPGSYVRVEFDDQWLGSAAQSCPRLGLMTDPDTRHAFASDMNRCYAVDGTAPVGLTYQNNCCLSSAHVNCPILSGEIKRPRLPINTEVAVTERPAGMGRRLANFLGRGKDGAG